jgi:hypothetical protein
MVLPLQPPLEVGGMPALPEASTSSGAPGVSTGSAAVHPVEGGGAVPSEPSAAAEQPADPQAVGQWQLHDDPNNACCMARLLFLIEAFIVDLISFSPLAGST